MTVKILVVHYLVFPAIISNKGVIIQEPCGAATELTILLLLTPTLYALMSFRAGAHLYGSFNSISSERLMHTDLIIHVSLDYFDIVDLCYIFNTISTAFYYNNDILQGFCGVLLGTSIFLHAYSFPRMSQTSKNSRKYAAIVGIFFVDLPFAIIRIVAWILISKHSVFGIFLLKNVCFTILQASRVRHCSIGIRTLNYSKKLMEAPGNVDLSTVNTLAEGEGQQGVGAESMQDEDSSVDSDCDTDVPGSRQEGRRSYVTFSTKAHHVDQDIHYNPLHRRSMRLSTMDTQRTSVTKINMPESFAVSAVSLKRMLQKILLVISVGTKMEIAHLLDSKLQLSLWQNALMAIPHIVVWGTEITIVIMFYRFNELSDMDYRGLFNFEGLSKMSFGNLPLCMRVTPFLILSASLVNFICWSLVGPLLGSLFAAVYVLVTLFSFSFVLLSLSEFIPALHILGFISQHIMGTPREYLFFFFGVTPFLNLLSGLYPFLCLTLGKNEIFYINPSVVSMKNSDIIRDSVNLINSSFAVNVDAIGDDESCSISLASLLVLTSAKIMCIPPACHSLLVGQNLIKATRLDRALISYHKNIFMRTLLIRMYCILMVVGKNGHNYSCAIVAYVLHLFLIMLHSFCSTAVRRIHIEAVNMQSLCADILKETKTQRMRYNKLMPYEKDHVNTTPLTTGHWIFKKHKRNKMFL
ncbi:hypothetical protein BgAZ_108000 [Babesia gibsoni]|uniref:Uncharacterized protein n=1 Tax=Babesia gibsoni TaxID=33632 RepID=A0AAD8PGF7_BABGI|nr:hypothetical protein BgAZ_108000 [Babesia gibsoni]